MNKINDEKVTFQPKFLISWLIVGAVCGAISLVSVASQGITASALLTSFIFLPFASVVYGGMGLFLNGIVNHHWRFGEIEYHPWTWHIYPLITMFALAIGFIVALFKMASRS